jgi:hypothetical protein
MSRELPKYREILHILSLQVSQYLSGIGGHPMMPFMGLWRDMGLAVKSFTLLGFFALI